MAEERIPQGTFKMSQEELPTLGCREKTLGKTKQHIRGVGTIAEGVTSTYGNTRRRGEQGRDLK